VANLPNVSHRPLVAIMLQESMPECVIEGMDIKPEDSQTDLKRQEDHSFETYEKLLVANINENMTGNKFKTLNIKF
jgi:hypothetical protein